jgi:hypothetical protein
METFHTGHPRQLKRPLLNRIEAAIIRWPILFGMFIAFVMAILMTVGVIFFPRYIDYWDKHLNFVTASLITAGYFSTFLFCARPWRRSRAFWPSIIVLLLLHILGVYLYLKYVGIISYWQWQIIAFVELVIMGFVLQKLSRSGRKTNQ